MSAALTRAQIAELLGCQPKHVGYLIATGALPAFDISLSTGPRPRWRVLETDLEVKP